MRFCVPWLHNSHNTPLTLPTHRHPSFLTHSHATLYSSLLLSHLNPSHPIPSHTLTLIWTVTPTSIMPSSQAASGHLAVDPKFLSSQPPSTAKASEPNRSKSYDPSKKHITEVPMTRRNWYKHVNWLNVFLIVGIPLLGCIQAFWTPLYWQTAVWAIAYYFMTGLGITAGESTEPLGHRAFRLHVCRLSSIMGSHVILRYHPSPHLPCRRWRGRC